MLKKKVSLILFTTLRNVFALTALTEHMNFDPGVSILFELLVAKQIQIPWYYFNKRSKLMLRLIQYTCH